MTLLDKFKQEVQTTPTQAVCKPQQHSYSSERISDSCTILFCRNCGGYVVLSHSLLEEMAQSLKIAASDDEVAK